MAGSNTASPGAFGETCRTRPCAVMTDSPVNVCPLHVQPSATAFCYYCCGRIEAATTQGVHTVHREPYDTCTDIAHGTGNARSTAVPSVPILQVLHEALAVLFQGFPASPKKHTGVHKVCPCIFLHARFLPAAFAVGCTYMGSQGNHLFGTT